MKKNAKGDLLILRARIDIMKKSMLVGNTCAAVRVRRRTKLRSSTNRSAYMLTLDAVCIRL